VIANHESRGHRLASSNGEAGTDGARDLAIGLVGPKLAVPSATKTLTGREAHSGAIPRAVDAQAIPGRVHALDLTGKLKTQRWEFDPLHGLIIATGAGGVVAAYLPISRHQSVNRLLNSTGPSALAPPAHRSATPSTAPPKTMARRMPPINRD
jgi:hypothetical protein